MYIYRKIKNNKTYYYLRESKRDKNRVITRDIAYLGNDPKEIMEELKSLNKYKNNIKESMRSLKRTIDYERYIEKAKALKLKKERLLGEESLFDVTATKLHFRDLLKKYDPVTIKDYYQNFSFEYTWNSSSIEGNTISLRGATQYFTEHTLPKDARDTEVYDLRNGQEECMRILKEYSNLEISHETISEIHKNLMRDIDKRLGYRTFEVRTIGSHKERSLSMYIKEDMEDLFSWYKESKNKLHPFILATVFHTRIEDIHPFADGNGRTGRLLFNLILLKQEYPPFIISKRNRKEYLELLDKAQSKKYMLLNISFKPLCEYFVSELKNSYWRCFE